MQLHADTDIDRAIAEFSAAVGDLFRDPQNREIELLKSKIVAAKLAHKKTSVYRRELCELLARKIQREVAA